MSICILTYWFCTGRVGQASFKRAELRWGMENWVESVRMWICGLIWKGNLHSISFVHLPHPAFLGRLNKMKSLSRTIVNMGEICVVKCFVKVICKWRRGSAVQAGVSQVRLRTGWGPWPCSNLLSLFTASGKLFLHHPHCTPAQRGRPLNYKPGWITSGHFVLETSGQCSTISYTGHLFLPLQFDYVC